MPCISATTGAESWGQRQGRAVLGSGERVHVVYTRQVVMSVARVVRRGEVGGRRGEKRERERGDRETEREKKKEKKVKVEGRQEDKQGEKRA